LALLWELLLNLHVQSELHKVGGFASMGSVPVTNAEHVHRLSLLYVGCQNESILVYFVWVAWLEANSGSKGKLFDHVLWLNVAQMSRVWRCRPLHRSQGRQEVIELLGRVSRCDWHRILLGLQSR